MNKIEEQLVSDGYWFWSKGDEQNPSTICTTSKWSKMMTILFKKSPYNIITEAMVYDYIEKFK